MPLRPSPAAHSRRATLGRGKRTRAIEISSVRRAEVITRRAVGRVLAAAGEVNEVIPKLLEAIGTTQQWVFGALWTMKPGAGTLGCQACWHSQADLFAATTCEAQVAPGVDLPGRAWASGKRVWLADATMDANFPRAAAAARAGLRGACAYPICEGSALFGVMEFFARCVRNPGPMLDELLGDLSSQIGRFIARVRAQEALRASEARGRAMLDASLDAIVSIDEQGRIVEYNRAAEAMLGYRREEVLGVPLVERIVPPSLRERHLEGFHRYLTTGEHHILGRRVEMPALRADGSELLVELTIVRLEAASWAMFTGYLRDLSAQKRGEQGQARLAAIVESAEDAITTKSLDGIIMTWNPAAERLFGYTAEEAIGQPVAMLVPPDRAEELRRILDAGRRGERIVHLETVRLHKDGHPLDVAVTISPIVDAAGRVTATSTVSRDLRAQKQTEAALRESEERLRLASEAAKVGLWFWDTVADHVIWTPACWEIAGVEPHPGVTFETFLEHLHPEDRGPVRAAIARSLAGEGEYEMTARIIRPDGEVRWIFSRGRPFHDDRGRPVRMMGVTIDITDQKRIELEYHALLESERAARDALERNLRLKDEFLATLSHELRTPLTAILGWTHILRRHPEAASVTTALAVIERNAQLQAQIVTDLLDMSRIVAGKLHLDARPIALEQVVGAAMETMRPAAEAKGISLGWDGADSDAAVVHGDADRLQQVFWNLISNAVKFTPQGGRIEVVQRRTGSSVEVRVTDTGQGITLDFLPHLFERFRQADASTMRKHGGLGLGLAIVQELIELHGGTVRAASDGPGTGATFTVTLPISAAQEGPEATRAAERRTATAAPSEEPPTSLQGLKVLVVDDQEDARDLVGRLLAQQGAQVVTAASAAEALEALERERPDVLVSDIGMPEMDGYALIRRVRALTPAHGGAMAAVALTAFVRKEDQDRARAEGYQAHLSKPIDAAKLINTVAGLVSRAATPSRRNGSG